jgi:predicted DNA-binding ribbon-helix-helix protein
MIRTQIQLDEQDFARLKQEAARRSCSVSAFVRESVKTALKASDENASLSSVREISGKYHSGKRDLSRNHDAYLEDGW